MLIRELPLDERPRERLLAHGPAILSNAELLSLLLRSGRPGLSAIELARELLAQTGGLSGLARGIRPSTATPGVGPTKVACVLAALELARRLARSEIERGQPMKRLADVARYLGLRYARDGQEVMGALYLDVRQRLLDEAEIYRGTLNRAAVEPRGILTRGLLVSAAGFVLFHTHPSGDASPSAEDLAFTERLSKAAEVVGLQLLDHLVLGGPSSWVSLRERGGR